MQRSDAAVRGRDDGNTFITYQAAVEEQPASKACSRRPRADLAGGTFERQCR